MTASALLALAGLAAFVAVGTVYGVSRWLRERLGFRDCPCFYCSSRRELGVSLHRGPSRFRAFAGHLHYRLSRIASPARRSRDA